QIFKNPNERLGNLQSTLDDIFNRIAGGLGVRCRLRDRTVPGSKPDSTEELSCSGPATR
ncbi:hypothetical protein AVEN_255353-1, partial [Araneus ventricosus]